MSVAQLIFTYLVADAARLSGVMCTPCGGAGDLTAPSEDHIFRCRKCGLSIRMIGRGCIALSLVDVNDRSILAAGLYFQTSCGAPRAGQRR